MPSTAQELVNLAINGEAAPFATKTHEILTTKIHDALEARKLMVAQQLFGKKAVEDAVSSVETPEVANTEVQPDAGATA